MRKQGQGWIGRGRETLSQHAREGVEAVRELRAHLLCRGLAQLLGRPGAARPAGRARMGVSCCIRAGAGAARAHAENGGRRGGGHCGGEEDWQVAVVKVAVDT